MRVYQNSNVRGCEVDIIPAKVLIELLHTRLGKGTHCKEVAIRKM